MFYNEEVLCSQEISVQPLETSKKSNDKSNLELLLELEEAASSLPTMTPTCGGLISPPTTPHDGEGITPVGGSLVPGVWHELASRAVWGGVGARYCWPRVPHLYSRSMCTVHIQFNNYGQNDVTNIRIHKKTLTGTRAIHDFAPIQLVAAGGSASAVLGVDFADTIQPIEFTIACSVGEVPVSITPPVGELMRAVTMSPSRWDAEHKKLRGMTECNKKAVKLEDEAATCQRVFETANLGPVTATGDLLRFSGRMLTSQDLVLLSVKIEDDATVVTANCSNMAIASLLANQVAQAFAKS
ncbi:unnamed protein product [Diatraea saccharalis]|uniref:AP-3 complex subunit beta C-terminal domain-containing protein n=1 Tax=Diatraea saccharalis TaxID=40085 RepID=A0A9N9WHA0_9NEOP|nr:unnamed protein product [Diatraea saccharalis]